MTLPARIGATQGDYIDIGGTRYEVKHAAIDAASSGDNTLISAVSGKELRVLSFFFIVAGAVTVRFESGAGGTALTGQMEFQSAGAGMAPPVNPYGHFKTAAGALLNLELSAAISVDGALTYIEADPI